MFIVLNLFSNSYICNPVDKWRMYKDSCGSSTFDNKERKQNNSFRQGGNN